MRAFPGDAAAGRVAWTVVLLLLLAPLTAASIAVGGGLTLALFARALCALLGGPFCS